MRYSDNVTYGTVAIKNRLPPPNLNLEIRKKAYELKDILNLSQYEIEVYSVLLAVPRPMIAGEIPNFTKVPRTKIYGALRKLIRDGLVTFVTVDEDMIEKPEIWGWWEKEDGTMGPKQKEFLRQYFCGINIYEVNRDYLIETYFDWTTVLFDKKTKIGDVISFVKDNPKYCLPVLDPLKDDTIPDENDEEKRKISGPLTGSSSTRPEPKKPETKKPKTKKSEPKRPRGRPRKNQ